MASTIAKANIATENGVRVWLCPNCGKKMAELHGSRVTIKVGSTTISLRTPEIEQTCPRCGECSEVESNGLGVGN